MWRFPQCTPPHYFPFPACLKLVPSSAPGWSPGSNTPCPGVYPRPVKPAATKLSQSTWVLLCTAATQGGARDPTANKAPIPALLLTGTWLRLPKARVPTWCLCNALALGPGQQWFGAGGARPEGREGAGVSSQATTWIKLGKPRCPVRRRDVGLLPSSLISPVYSGPETPGRREGTLIFQEGKINGEVVLESCLCPDSCLTFHGISEGLLFPRRCLEVQKGHKGGLTMASSLTG